eukprot:TRINITY_DN14110_c3_g1_i2.p1 TRINITY_DN14110_c3_g1~~TRINITY_DN14110_c3_g1_i2.p1  ORF type:complete len:109 (+),score=12.47 TRINITY_DN14110_c3_g1_i2:272-598(+)
MLVSSNTSSKTFFPLSFKLPNNTHLSALSTELTNVKTLSSKSSRKMILHKSLIVQPPLSLTIEWEDTPLPQKIIFSSKNANNKNLKETKKDKKKSQNTRDGRKKELCK